MKSLSWPSGLIVSSLLLTLSACTDHEPLLPDSTTNPNQIPASQLLTDAEKVCNLLQHAVDLFAETPIDAYFDSTLFVIYESENPTGGQLTSAEGYFQAGLASMISDDPAFEDALNSVIALELSQQQLTDYLEQCEPVQPRWCLICNTKACNVSVSAIEFGLDYGQVAVSVVFSLGWLIHCDH